MIHHVLAASTNTDRSEIAIRFDTNWVLNCVASPSKAHKLPGRSAQLPRRFNERQQHKRQGGSRRQHRMALSSWSTSDETAWKVTVK